jgi:hypothetical protein
LNDATYNSTCERIQKLIDRIQLELGLNSYSLNVRYVRDAAPDGPRGGQVTMEVTSSWEYCDIHIIVYVQACHDYTDDKLELIIWHEFMHVMISPLRITEGSHDNHQLTDAVDVLEERVCTDLAKALRWTARERVQEVEIQKSAEIMKMVKDFNRETKLLNLRIKELEALVPATVNEVEVVTTSN